MHNTISPATAHVDLFATDEDARRLTAASLLCTGIAPAHLLLAAWGWLPAWTLALSMPILVPRWMIAVHELFHLRTEREVDGVTRLLPFLFTFLCLGYRELLANHRSHHRHMSTPADAEYYQLRGSKLRGLLNAFSSPEQLWFRWIAQHGIDRELLRHTLVRLALFLGLIWACGATFLWYWIPARIAFGASYFTFFYCLHRRGAEFGVYPLAIPRPLRGAAKLIWGRDVVEATLHHDIHHVQPRIAAQHLCRSRVAIVDAQTAAETQSTG